MLSALLVLDFINDIADQNGKIARSSERIFKNKVIEKANEAISHARKMHWPILFIKVGFHLGYPECPKHSPLFGAAESLGALLLGSWGTDFHKDLNVHETDLVIVKHRVSAFYGTSMEPILKAKGIQRLVIAGTATNMAVEHTARDAHDRDYSVLILEDACEAATEEAHRGALESMSRFAKIINTDAFIQGASH
jgi:nicotinamidase-related amidase